MCCYRKHSTELTEEALRYMILVSGTGDGGVRTPIRAEFERETRTEENPDYE